MNDPILAVLIVTILIVLGLWVQYLTNHIFYVHSLLLEVVKAQIEQQKEIEKAHEKKV